MGTLDEFILEVISISAEIQEASLCEESVEVASTIAGYIAKINYIKL